MRKTVLPAIRVQEDGLGPAMLALSPSMRAYVVARVFYGLNRSRAAHAAGYSTPTPDVAKVQGYRLEHDERIQAAIAEESRKLMRAEGPQSVRTLIEIRDNKQNEAKDRLKAAQSLLDRAGMGAVSEAHLTVDHHHHLTDAQKDARILALCQELGLPEAAARKLLIAPDVIDAEFEEVSLEPKTQEQIERAERYQRTNEAEQLRQRNTMTPAERETHKLQVREQRSSHAKARYQKAQQPEETTGREGLEDLIGETS